MMTRTILSQLLSLYFVDTRLHKVARSTLAGHHAALHGAVFDVLRDGMGVDIECFASPLNCRWHRYCSPFVDTDATFGSLGSFFDFTPSEGSFECNPQFIIAYILRTVKHITALIEAAERSSKALSFVIITPHWPGKTSGRIWRAVLTLPMLKLFRCVNMVFWKAHSMPSRRNIELHLATHLWCSSE